MEMTRYYPDHDGQIVKVDVHADFPRFVRVRRGYSSLFTPVYKFEESEAGPCSNEDVYHFENPVVPDSRPNDLVTAFPSYLRGSNGKILPLSLVFKNRNGASDS